MRKIGLFPFTGSVLAVLLVVLFGLASAPPGLARSPLAEALRVRNGSDNTRAAPAAQTNDGGVVTAYNASVSLIRGMTTGPNGALWYTNGGNNTIGEITTDGKSTIYSGSGIDQPWGITSGPDDDLWFTNLSGNTIGRISTSGVVTIYKDKRIDEPQGIAEGSDGDIWFTNSGDDEIGRITPSGYISIHKIGIIDPIAITSSPHGLWVTGDYGIGHITANGYFHFYSSPSSPYNQPLGQAITTGRDGNLWFTDDAGSSIGRMTPQGKFTFFINPDIQSPEGITAGPDGRLWFANDNSDYIGAITTSGSVTEYPVSSNADWIADGPDGRIWVAFNNQSVIAALTTSGQVSYYLGNGLDGPYGVASGPDGALWITNWNGTITRLTTKGVATNYSGADIDYPTSITAGPDAAMWFTSRGNNMIGRIAMSGKIAMFTNATIDNPYGITRGPDGGLWFVNNGTGTIGHITKAGEITDFSGSGIEADISITAGPNGNMWFCNREEIGEITTTGKLVELYQLPAGMAPTSITKGPDGALWFTNDLPNSNMQYSIGRITVSGVVTNYILSGNSQPPEIGSFEPVGITAGPDGALWSTEQNGDVGRITTAGAITTYQVPGTEFEQSITTGSDGAMWFTCEGLSSVDRISVVPSAAAWPDSGGPGAFVFAGGGGYTPGETVQVSYATGLTSPITEEICSATAAPNGTFWCFGDIPRGTGAGTTGSHTIFAEGESSHALATTPFGLT